LKGYNDNPYRSTVYGALFKDVKRYQVSPVYTLGDQLLILAITLLTRYFELLAQRLHHQTALSFIETLEYLRSDVDQAKRFTFSYEGSAQALKVWAIAALSAN